MTSATLSFSFCAAVASVSGSAAFGQATQPAVFVCNNGNLEGSVTAFRVDANGALDFANRVVTGTRTSTTQPCAGCNAYEISLSPDGSHLVTSHPAGDLDGITFFRVSADASITQVLQIALGGFQQGGPLDIVWIDNQHVAFTRLDTNPDQIVIARFNPAVPSMTELTWTPMVGSLGYLATHPNGQYLYANDTSNRTIRAYSFNPINGAITLIDTESTGAPFPLEIAISGDGTKLYAAGGISDSSNKVMGMIIEPNGTLTSIPGTPFISPGASPSNVFVGRDDDILAVGHGTDATVRILTIDPSTGVPTATAHMFDVGLQGTLGDVRMMDDLLFITDNSTATDGLMGVYSFKVDETGALTQNGPIISSQGIAPRSIATWKPPAAPCPADLGGDGNVGVPDLLAIINGWGPCPIGCPPACAGDFDEDCSIGVPDLLVIINQWGPCP